MCSQWETVLRIKWQIIYDFTTKRLVIMQIQNNKSLLKHKHYERTQANQFILNKIDAIRCSCREKFQCSWTRREDEIRYQSAWLDKQAQNATKAFRENGNREHWPKGTILNLQTSLTNAHQPTTVCARVEHLWLWFVPNEWMNVSIECGFLCVPLQFGSRLFYHWIC